MSDIVERLRAQVHGDDLKSPYDGFVSPLDAADEIERLRAALREILDSVAVTASGVEICQCSDFDSARAALEKR